MKFNQIIFRFLITLLILSCSKKDDGPSAPSPTQLQSPSNNSICNGVDNGTTVNVNFSWLAVSSAKSYRIEIFNAIGELIFSQTTQNTFLEVSLNKTLSFSWNVKSINEAGESSSNSFVGSTPGESIPNRIPYIHSIELDVENNLIRILVQDQEDDALSFDAYIAENSTFSNMTTIAKDRAVEKTQNNSQRHEIILENIQWTAVFWFKIILKDQLGNQVVETMSYRF